MAMQALLRVEDRIEFNDRDREFFPLGIVTPKILVGSFRGPAQSEDPVIYIQGQPKKLAPDWLNQRYKVVDNNGKVSTMRFVDMQTIGFTNGRLFCNVLDETGVVFPVANSIDFTGFFLADHWWQLCSNPKYQILAKQVTPEGVVLGDIYLPGNRPDRLSSLQTGGRRGGFSSRKTNGNFHTDYMFVSALRIHGLAENGNFLLTDVKGPFLHSIDDGRVFRLKDNEPGETAEGFWLDPEGQRAVGQVVCQKVASLALWYRKDRLREAIPVNGASTLRYQCSISSGPDELIFLGAFRQKKEVTRRMLGIPVAFSTKQSEENLVLNIGGKPEVTPFREMLDRSGLSEFNDLELKPVTSRKIGDVVYLLAKCSDGGACLLSLKN